MYLLNHRAQKRTKYVPCNFVYVLLSCPAKISPRGVGGGHFAEHANLCIEFTISVALLEIRLRFPSSKAKIG